MQPDDCPCNEGWVCEGHPYSPWPHTLGWSPSGWDCPGPGMPCKMPEHAAVAVGLFTESLTSIEAKVEQEAPAPYCCYINPLGKDCGDDATWRLYEGYSADAYTDSCILHLNELVMEETIKMERILYEPQRVS